MVRCFYEISAPVSRKYASIVLASCWLLGLVCGAGLYNSAGDVTASLMRQAAFSPVSIVNLLISFFLPFLFSAFAVYMDKPGFLAVVAFIKACSFGFCSLGTLEAYGSAGWLIRVLLMFSDICFTMVLYLYWMRHFGYGCRFSAIRCSAYCATALLIGSVDFCFVAPNLARIITI